MQNIGPTTPKLSGDWRTDKMLARTHKMYIHLKALIALRKSCIALRSGDIDWITASDDRGAS